MSVKQLFAALRKNQDGSIFFVKADDGTIQVEGVASSESVDSQGEVIKASAMAAALPEYLKFPALREMHQPLAAGKTLAADVAEDGCTYITAKVVDPVAVKKVMEGVYAGFSIGGTVPPGGRSKDNPKVIEQLKLVEISLVDRPANPEAVFSLVKMDTGTGDAVTKTGDAATKTDPPAGTPAPTQTTPPAKGATTTAKGMFTVGWVAELCGQLAALASDTQWETDFEGDDSEIPGRIKAVCAELGDILLDMAAEEVGELMAAKGTDAVALLAAPGTLKRSERVAVLARAFLAASGRKVPELPELVDLRKRVEEAEGATKQAGDALKRAIGERDDLHKKHADAVLALKAKGVPRDPKFIESVAKAEALDAALKEAQGATEQAGEALRKVLAERDELKAQRDQLSAAISVNTEKAKEQLEGVIEERDVLQQQLTEKVTALAKAEVALKTKGVLRAVPVAKQDDVDRAEAAGSKPPEGTVERALFEMKKVQARGGRPLTLGGLPPASQENAR